MPDIALKSIYDLDLDKLKSLGIKGIILDIDNTLESHKTPKPSKKVIDFLEKLSENGFKICFISNGKHKRVRVFNEDLKLFALSKAGKPKKKGYKKAAEMMQLSPKETAMAGDQIFTDVFGAKRSGMVSILVEPIESIENKFFYIKRFFEKGLRKRIKTYDK